MNKLSLMSFILGWLALLIVVLSLLDINLSFLGMFGLIIFYLPILGLGLGFISFFQKPNKKELVFSVIGIIFAVIIYIYLFYLILSLAKNLSNF